MRIEIRALKHFFFFENNTQAGTTKRKDQNEKVIQDTPTKGVLHVMT